MEVSLRAKAEEFADQHTTPEDLNAFIRLMMKAAVERMLDTEMDVHLGRRGVRAAGPETLAESPSPAAPADAAASFLKRRSNHRNGRSKKTVSGDLGGLMCVALVGLNYHFVGDVVAGAMLGSVTGVYATRIFRLRPVGAEQERVE